MQRSGIPVAAIVTVEELRRLEQMDDRREQLFAVLTAISDKFKDVPPEELEREVNKAVAEARAEHRAERAEERSGRQPSSLNP